MTALPSPLIHAARSGTAVGLAQLIGHTLSFLLSVVIAAKFGAAETTDAYFMAFSTSELLTKILLGGALTSVLLPVFVEALTRDDPDRAWRLFSSLFSLAAVSFLLLGGALELLAEPLVRFLAPGFSGDARLLTASLLRIALPAYLFMFLTDLATVPLHAHRRFGLPAATRLLAPFTTLVTLLALAGRMGIFAIAIGSVMGAALQTGVLLGALRHSGYRFRLASPWANPDARRVLALTLPFALSILAADGAGVVYRILVSHLPEGSLASLKFGEKIFQMTNLLFMGTIAQVAFPVFAQAVASGSGEIVRDRLRTAVRLAAFLGVPLTVGIILLREPIVRVLFERGAFTSTAAAATAMLVPLFMIGLIGNGVSSLLGHLTLALQRTKISVAVNIALQTIAASLFVLLVPRLGVAGLALVSGLGPFVLTALYLFALRNVVPNLSAVFLDRVFMRLALAGGACGVLVAATTTGIHTLLPPGVMRDFASLLAGGGAGLGAFLTTAWLLRVPEIGMFWDLARHAARSVMK